MTRDCVALYTQQNLSLFCRCPEVCDSADCRKLLRLQMKIRSLLYQVHKVAQIFVNIHVTMSREAISQCHLTPSVKT